MRSLRCTDELQARRGLLVRGIAAWADADFENWGSDGMFVPELFGETAAGGSGGRAAHRVNGLCDCQEPVMNGRGLRDQSKRDSSTAWRGSFAGANEEKKTAPLRSE
jgi:hypothetical protein